MMRERVWSAIAMRRSHILQTDDKSKESVHKCPFEVLAVAQASAAYAS